MCFLKVMGNKIQKMTFEIDNFSQRDTPIQSDKFTSGSCNWCVAAYPKGKGNSTHLSLYLLVDPLSRPQSQSWSRCAKFCFTVVNQSKVRSTGSPVIIFNEKQLTWGFSKAFLLTELQERFLVNDKLTIEVYIDVKYVIGRLDTHVLPKKKDETVNVNGFQVFHSQVKSAKLIFETYPETALYIQPQDPQIKTAYMNVLLRIYKNMYNIPLEKLTEAELSNVSKGLLDLTQAGFKLEWLREKLEKVSVERKKLRGYEAQAEELGKQLKNLELMMCNLNTEIIKLKAER